MPQLFLSAITSIYFHVTQWTCSPNVSTMAEFYSRIVAIVTTEILAQKRPEQRARVMAKVIKVARTYIYVSEIPMRSTGGVASEPAFYPQLCDPSSLLSFEVFFWSGFSLHKNKLVNFNSTAKYEVWFKQNIYIYWN